MSKLLTWEAVGRAFGEQMSKPHGEGTLWAKGCECARCLKMREITDEGRLIIPMGGWGDPRRHYLEGPGEFLERVPDGFVELPDDCKWARSGE